MADDHELLIVFLAEYRHAGLHAGKQFQHHRADAAKETRPEFTLEYAAQVRRGLHLEILRLRIHFPLVGGKQHINIALTFKLLDIGSQGARIMVEILVRSELQTIHENRQEESRGGKEGVRK